MRWRDRVDLDGQSIVGLRVADRVLGVVRERAGPLGGRQRRRVLDELVSAPPVPCAGLGVVTRQRDRRCGHIPAVLTVWCRGIDRDVGRRSLGVRWAEREVDARLRRVHRGGRVEAGGLLPPLLRIPTHRVERVDAHIVFLPDVADAVVAELVGRVHPDLEFTPATARIGRHHDPDFDPLERRPGLSVVVHGALYRASRTEYGVLDRDLLTECSDRDGRAHREDGLVVVVLGCVAGALFHGERDAVVARIQAAHAVVAVLVGHTLHAAEAAPPIVPAHLGGCEQHDIHARKALTGLVLNVPGDVPTGHEVEVAHGGIGG